MQKSVDLIKPEEDSDRVGIRNLCEITKVFPKDEIPVGKFYLSMISSFYPTKWLSGLVGKLFTYFDGKGPFYGKDLALIGADMIGKLIKRYKEEEHEFVKDPAEWSIMIQVSYVKKETIVQSNLIKNYTLDNKEICIDDKGVSYI